MVPNEKRPVYLPEGKQTGLSGLCRVQLSADGATRRAVFACFFARRLCYKGRVELDPGTDLITRWLAAIEITLCVIALLLIIAVLK